MFHLFFSPLFRVVEVGRKPPIILKCWDGSVAPRHTVPVANPETSIFGNRPDVSTLSPNSRQRYFSSNRQRAHRLRIKE